jgi:hypothetical protein
MVTLQSSILLYYQCFSSPSVASHEKLLFFEKDRGTIVKTNLAFIVDFVIQEDDP